MSQRRRRVFQNSGRAIDSNGANLLTPVGTSRICFLVNRRLRPVARLDSGARHILTPVVCLTSVRQLRTEGIMNTVKGLSFGIADLMLVQAWSEAQRMRMVVRLDHGTMTEDYEEVLALHSDRSAPCRWFMWRESDSVVVQPLIGRSRRYGSVVEALEAMEPRRRGAPPVKPGAPRAR
jgi:hypothetical protein